MNPESKICPPHNLAQRLATLPRPLVMTNGVFDVLHRGHVSYLHAARELGASLLVAINSDDSARGLGKGPGRPLNAAEDRACVLAGLASVDLVTYFDTPTPVELIRAIRPDIYVKGGDYDMEMLEETRVVRSWGGKSLAIPFIDGFSTSALVQRIRKSVDNKPNRMVFLDRDCAITKGTSRNQAIEEVDLGPDVLEGISLLLGSGFSVALVSQSTFADTECLQPERSTPWRDAVFIGNQASDFTAVRARGVARAYLVTPDSTEFTSGNNLADAQFNSVVDCARHLACVDALAQRP